MKRIILSFGLALVLAASAHAQVFTGTTLGGPTWNRPLAGTPPTGLSAVGTNTPYNVLQFSVNLSGSYSFLDTATNPANWDNFTFLYQTSFSSINQLTNVLIGNDDNPSIGLSGFSYNLSAGVNYFFITTGFGNTDSGDYSLSITGPGVATAVPEPSAVAAFALGAVCLGLLRIRHVRRARIG